MFFVLSFFAHGRLMQDSICIVHIVEACQYYAKYAHQVCIRIYVDAYIDLEKFQCIIFKNEENGENVTYLFACVFVACVNVLAQR